MPTEKPDINDIEICTRLISFRWVQNLSTFYGELDPNFVHDSHEQNI